MTITQTPSLHEMQITGRRLQGCQDRAGLHDLEVSLVSHLSEVQGASRDLHRVWPPVGGLHIVGDERHYVC